MQALTGNIHIVDGLRGIQCSKLKPESLCVTPLNAGSTSGLEKLGKALVPDGLDHGQA
jgi:hypothetical protein